MSIPEYTAVSFDDVLVRPSFNTVESRDHVKLATRVGYAQLPGPLIAANMPSVCEADMAAAMTDFGMGIIHRMCSIQDQVAMVKKAKDLKANWVGAAVGIGEDYMDRAGQLLDAGALVLCLDVAHGHQERVGRVATRLLNEFSYTTFIIGNIATSDAARYFSQIIPREKQSFVALKVGVGGGSVCTTRIMTGCGVPTLQSVQDVCFALAEEESKMTVIADGGIRNSGDIVKCLAAGADAVMLGGLLAGTDQAPGDVLADGDRLVKVYRGAASYGEKKEYFGDAEYVEGAERLVPYKGDVSSVCKKLLQGVRSGMTYVGASTVRELRGAQFVRISPAGYRESLPHGLY